MMNNSAYTTLSKYYDRLMSGYDYGQAFEFVLQNVKDKTKGVDIACGSGKFAIELAKHGKKVFGIDNSQQMLNEAANNAKSEAQNVVFVYGDMEELELPKIDFAVAMCDAVNYLPNKKSIRNFFSAVYKALSDFGVFIFDVSSIYKLNKLIENSPYYEDYDDLTVLWTNSKNSNRYTMDLSFFVKDKDVYKRFDERHVQCAYSYGELETILKECGFGNIKVLSDKFTAPYSRSKRYYFSAVKNG